MRLFTQLSLFGIRLAPVLLSGYWVLIFTGTHMPTVPMPEIKNLDKVQHFLAFLGLAFLLAWSIPGRGNYPRVKMTFAFVIAVCYGVFDEITQQWVGRTTDILDFAADACGALTGILVYWIARRILFPHSMRKQPRTRYGGEAARELLKASNRNAA